MNYSEWEATYKPVKNSMVEGAAFDGHMFETYGEELEQVKSHPHNYIWTYRAEDGFSVITAGYGLVNRMGYFLTSVPWTSDIDVQLSEEVECSCYKEDGYTDKFGETIDGDPACETCEGYGRYENWLD